MDRRVPGAAAALAAAASLGLVAVAEPAHAASLRVSQTSGLAPAGQSVTVSGSGYAPDRNNGFGVYVVFGPRRADFHRHANAFASAVWVHKGGGGDGQAKMSADGTFTVTLDVTARYTDGDGRSVDCVRTRCFVMTMAGPVPAAATTVRTASVQASGRAAPGPGGVTWAVRPAGPKGPSGRDYFVYSVSPGQTITDKVSISNLSEDARTFRVYATDAFNTADGSFALLTADKEPSGVGTWVDFAKGSYKVEPGKTIDIPFTLTVPHDATPGDHGGGIVASVARRETTSGGRTVNVDRRVAARVYLRAAGPLRPSLQISALRTEYTSGGRMDVAYTVRNTGNVRVAAHARIGVEGPFGVTLGEPVARRIPELLPGSGYTFRERVGDIAPAGRLTTSIRLSATDPRSGEPLAGARPIVRRASLWHVPWTAAGAVVLLLGAVLYAVRRRRAGK